MAKPKPGEVLRPDVRQDREVRKWALILPALLIGALLLGLVVANALYGRSNYTVGMYDMTRPVAMVTFREVVYKPAGPPEAIRDTQMVAVDYTDQGHLVYTTKANLEGGGGGRPELGATPLDYGKLYLRTQDGYVPLKRTK